MNWARFATLAVALAVSPVAWTAAMLRLTVDSAWAQGDPPNIWYKICFGVPSGPTAEATYAPPQEIRQETGDATKICITQADIRDNATAALIAKVAVRQITGQDKPQLTVMVPLGPALRSPAALQIDNSGPIKLPFATCDKAGCYADAAVETGLLDQMKNGSRVAFS